MKHLRYLLLLPVILLLTGASPHLPVIARKNVAAPGGGFPVVESTAIGNYGAGTVADGSSVALPSGVAEGDLLVIEIGSSTSTTATASGWTNSSDSWGASYNHILWKVAGASETDPVVVTMGSATRTAWTVRRISGYSSIELPADETSGNDAASFSPSWGSANTLYITVYSARASDWSVDTAPTGFTTGVLESKNASSSLTTRHGIASGLKESTATSEDAEAWTITGTISIPYTFTYAIEP